MILPRRHHPRHLGQGYAAGVAFEGRHQLHAVFSLLVVVIFSFSFDPTAEESRQIAGGLIWVAFLFAAVVALNQTWAREIAQSGARRLPGIAGAARIRCFWRRRWEILSLSGVLEGFMTPLFVVFYDLRPLGPAWELIPVALLGPGPWW